MGDRVRWALRHDLPGETDEQLTDRARTGDKSAFGELYRRHRKAAESTAWCLLRSKTDADDVVSEAFTGVLSALRNGRGPQDNFRSYLLACVRNGCRVKRMPPMPIDDDQLERWTPALEDPERYIEADTVARAFSSLTPRWQHTLWLTEVEQHSPSEVGARLQLSPNATAALAHRARQAFAAAYLAEHVGAVTDKECVRAAPHLAGYVRDQLTEPQLVALERHLVNCSHCSAAVAELRDVNASLRSLLPAAPEALAGAALVAETTLVATSLGGASSGLPGAGVLLKGLAAVLLVAPILSTDIPHGNGRAGHAEENIVAVGEAAGGGIASPARDDAMLTVSESASSTAPASSAPETIPAEPAPFAPLAVPSDFDELLPTGNTGRPSTSTSIVPEVTLPEVTLQPILELVDDAVEDIVKPLVGVVTEPLVETLDEALALMGLGNTGETVTMLRNLVPLLDGPLVGALLDELLDLTSIVPADAPAGTPPGSTIGGLGDALPTSGQTTVSTPPSGGSPLNPNAPGANPGSSAQTNPGLLPDLPSISVPAISLPAISLPSISLPAISIPPIALLGLPPITLPVISIPPITLPTILG